MSNIHQLIELDKKHYLHPASPAKDNFVSGPMVIMERGEGIYLYDRDGKQYIDGLSSLWNVNIGHGRKEIAQVAEAQMSKMAFSHSFNRFSHEGAIRLAEKIASLAPGNLGVCQFTSGGSEANETAFKLIRHYFKLKGESKRYKIISRRRAYHGISIAATSATGIPVFHDMAGPLADGFVHAAAPYSYRCEVCQPACNGDCSIQSIRQLILQEGPESVAAVIVEPVQGAGGVIVPPPGYLAKVRKLCDEFGLLMVADEVITGFGRTGKWFGVNHDEVVPDIMTVAKGITSGYIPLGGVIISERLHREIVDMTATGQLLAHGYTYSGHPTACAVALKNIEIMEAERLVENANNMGRLLAAGLDQIKKESTIIGNVSCKGLIASVELVQDKSSKTPFPGTMKTAVKLFESALKRGLITRAIAIDNTDIVAVCPPLIINQTQISQMLDILNESIREVESSIL
jgi:putrescine aminotransferase